ncbi:MAG: transporter [Lachnospiraceae bacterium]|nr:transporter [Lachnospiraceae bacterium]
MQRLRKQKEKVFRMVMRFEHLLDLAEILLALIVVVALAVCLIPILKEIPQLLISGADEGFRHFLRQLLDLVIGIEFVKMLIKHTPSSVLEVMAFAIARHMVVTETSALEDLVAVLSIGAIFLIRRYSYIRSFESSKDELAMQWLEPTDLQTEGSRNPDLSFSDHDNDTSTDGLKAD